MKESYTNSESAFIASSASASHEKGDSQRANPLVLQDSPEDDDEPPIRPSTETPQQIEHSHQIHTNAVEDKSSSFHAPGVHHATQSTLVVEKRPFDRDTAELAQYLHTSLSSGLDESEAQARLKHYGKNILKGQGKVTVWAVLWRQVSNAMTVILLGALAIAFATEDYAEGGVIAGTTALLLFSSELDLFSDDSDRCCQCWYWIFSGISRGEDHGITQEIKFPHCHSHKNTQRSLDRRLHSHFRHHHRRSRRTSNRSSRPGRSPSIQHLQSRNR